MTLALLNVHHTFVLPSNVRAAVMAPVFDRNVKSSIVTKTHLTDVAIFFVFPTETVNRKVVAPWQKIFP